MDIASIQELMNKKAERRLDKDLADFAAYVCKHPLVMKTEKIKVGIVKDGEVTGKTSLLRMLEMANGELRSEMKKLLLPEYQREQNETMMKEWDEISKKIAEVYEKMDEVKELIGAG